MDIKDIVLLIQRKAQKYYLNSDNMIEEIMRETGLNRAEVFNIINEMIS